MADTISPSVSSFRAHFVAKAVPPEKETSQAEDFMTLIKNELAAGHQPPADVVDQGKKLLGELNDQTERYVFNMAQLLSEQELSGDELDAKVQAVSKGLERAEMTSQKLAKTLEKIIA